MLSSFKVVLFGILLLVSAVCEAQNNSKTEQFNIHAFGMDVGTITVNQQQEGDKIIVEAISLVEVRIVFKFKVKYIQTSIYEKGELLESKLLTYKKGEVNSDTRLTKNNNGYTLTKDGEISQINEKITFSGSLLYFNEPVNISNLYFEIDGKKTTVKAVEPHKYIVINPDNGKENEYFYKKGVLQKAIVKSRFAKVYLDKNPDFLLDDPLN